MGTFRLHAVPALAIWLACFFDSGRHIVKSEDNHAQLIFACVLRLQLDYMTQRAL